MQGDASWNVEEIDLTDYDLRQLPHSPSCPILVKLNLSVPSLAVIPPTFFEDMPMLEVLDLSNTHIASLPTSISNLKLLREFFLRDCFALIELPTQVGMLLKLKLFDIEGTELMFIPKEMGELKHLEVLHVSLSQYAKYYIKTNNVSETVIPRKMISQLKQLKELCVTISVGQEPEWWEEEVIDLQKELCDLENLKTLRWYLPTKEVLQQFLLLKRNDAPIYETLSDMKLTIGQHAQLTSCLPPGLEKKFGEFINCLKWINAEGNVDHISEIMESVEALFLSRHWTIEKLSTFDVTHLKYCLVAECNKMETLVEVDDMSEDEQPEIKNGDKIGLELLQYLSIHHMEKLQSIWKGRIGEDSFSKLRILALHTCSQLTSVFTPTIAQNLSCLTELTVEDCCKVTSLISSESENVTSGPIFPCLEKIFLLDLPKLVNIFVGQIILESLKNLLIYGCLQLQDLSNMELPHIEKIEGETEWWDGLGAEKSRWGNIFEPLKETNDLIVQLFEATNSLEHFRNTLSIEENSEWPTPSFESTSAEVDAKTDDTPKDTKQVKNITPARQKYWHEFSQKPEMVVVTIYAEDIPDESVSVNFGIQSLSLKICVPGEETYYFQPLLFGKIIRTKCTYLILSTYIEILLPKVEPISWTSLEFSKINPVARHPTAFHKFISDLYKEGEYGTRKTTRKSSVLSDAELPWKEGVSKEMVVN